MIIRHCPQCHERTLITTGAFWACSACGLAVTEQALTIDLANRPKGREEVQTRGKRR
jgi:ribosomal protein L37AE/L43A